MKGLVSVILIFVLLFSLTACNDNATEVETQSAVLSNDEEADASSEEITRIYDSDQGVTVEQIYGYVKQIRMESEYNSETDMSEIMSSKSGGRYFTFLDRQISVTCHEKDGYVYQICVEPSSSMIAYAWQEEETIRSLAVVMLVPFSILDEVISANPIEFYNVLLNGEQKSRVDAVSGEIHYYTYILNSWEYEYAVWGTDMLNMTVQLNATLIENNTTTPQNEQSEGMYSRNPGLVDSSSKSTQTGQSNVDTSSRDVMATYPNVSHEDDNINYGTNTNNTSSASKSDRVSSVDNRTECEKYGHDWNEITKTVHHEEEGHYEEVIVDYNVINTYKCPLCSQTFHSIGDQYYSHFQTHVDQDSNVRFLKDSYKTLATEYEPIYETQWIVDTPAYDETVITGYECGVCGKSK